MTDQERALEIARVRLDEADLAFSDAEEAAAEAARDWREADRLYDRVEAGDPDAIREILEGQQ
jgi:hypothetical protein